MGSFLFSPLIAKPTLYTSPFQVQQEAGFFLNENTLGLCVDGKRFRLAGEGARGKARLHVGRSGGGNHRLVGLSRCVGPFLSSAWAQSGQHDIVFVQQEQIGVASGQFRDKAVTPKSVFFANDEAQRDDTVLWGLPDEFQARRNDAPPQQPDESVG